MEVAWSPIDYLRLLNLNRSPCVHHYFSWHFITMWSDDEQCGVDINKNDSVLFGYRTFAIKRRNIFFLNVHVQYKYKDVTQGACYGRDSCKHSEGRLWFIWMFSMIPRDEIVISVKITTYFVISRFFRSQYHNVLLICFPICMINLR